MVNDLKAELDATEKRLDEIEAAQSKAPAAGGAKGTLPTPMGGAACVSPDTCAAGAARRCSVARLGGSGGPGARGWDGGAAPGADVPAPCPFALPQPVAMA